MMKKVELASHPLFGVSLIEASAGTGKTFTIAHLYLRYLLETEFTVQQILIVTFTNAATQELRGRIRTLVYELSRYLLDASIVNEEFDVLFQRYRGNDDAIRKLQKALVLFDEVSIFSIHGFCQRILNGFPVETHSLLQQEIVNSEGEMQQQAVEDFWRKHVFVENEVRLHWIVSQWLSPRLLLAEIKPLLGFEEQWSQIFPGPESLQQKLTGLWQQLQQHWQQSAQDIRTVLLDNPVLNRNRVRPKTVTGLLDQLEALMEGEIPYDLPNKWELLTATRLNECLNSGKKDDRLLWPFFTVTETFAPIHRQWIRQQKITVLIQAARYVKDQVEQRKTVSSLLTFDDLISDVSRVIIPENTGLIEKINRQYPVAMVDEFQDTDSKQYQIFKNLYQGHADKALIMIGDPKQAIYSFRGADVFTYQQARNATSSQYTLSTNYRSTVNYVEAINRVFAFQDNAFLFSRFIKFHPAQANLLTQQSLSAENGPVAPLVAWLLPWQKKPQGKTEAMQYFADCCAEEIVSLLTRSELKLDGASVEARDLAILVKTGQQASLMKSTLAKRGIACAMIQRDSVFASEQALDISQLLAALMEPQNNSLLFGLLATDLFGWNSRRIHELQSRDRLLVSLLEQIQEYRQQWQQQGILSMFFSLLADQHTLQNQIRRDDGERRMTNWLHIIELLQQQSTELNSHSQLLHWLQRQIRNSETASEKEEHQLRLESDSNLVRIVTVHKSKGLQYPIVFLPFMWHMKQRKLPTSYSYHDEQGRKHLMIEDETQSARWQQENLAEEMRLFYVAMTRARYRCYLAWGHIKDAGYSAIAHLLYADADSPPSQDEQAFLYPFQQISEQGRLLDLRYTSRHMDTRKKGAVAMLAMNAQKTSAPALSFTRKLQQQWYISSYSQMVSTHLQQASIDRPDYDSVVSTAAVNMPDQIKSRFNFYKGASAGNFLHSLLEVQPFNQKIDDELIQRKLQEYGYESEWGPVISQWLSEVLETPLGEFRLSDLSAQKKVCEMEFYMRCKSLKARPFNQLLYQHGYLLPDQALSFSDLKGFLKGFIDLVFEYQGRYFIADYKSNFLGNDYSEYDDEACRAAMHQHHYPLQYLIYTLALHRYLRQRINNYDYRKHFGGVYYLFLRGMSPQKPGKGVYQDLPDIDLIHKLEGLFD